MPGAAPDAYDFRDREISTDGEIDFYEAYTYDNVNRLIQTDRQDTTSSGNLVARNATSYDLLGRPYQTTVYGVDPSTGTVGNALVSNTWYDPSGNGIKQLDAGSSAFKKMVFDGAGRTAAPIHLLQSFGDGLSLSHRCVG